MNIKYKITIIIPVYNGEKYIDRCLESILCQLDKDVEIIIVDDGSNDNSLKICEKYKRDNISIIHQINQGVSVARNVGINKSIGEFIVFIDVDDYIYPNLIRTVKEVVFKDYDFVLFNYSCDKYEYDSSDYEIELEEKQIKQLINKFLGQEELFPKIKNHLNAPWGKVYKREFLIDNNIKFIPGIKIGEDVVFNVNVFKYAQKAKYVDKKLYVYSYNDNVSSAVHKYDENLLENDKKYYKHLKNTIILDDEILSLFNSCIARGLIEYYHSKIFNKQNKKSNLEKYKESLTVIEEWPYSQVVENYDDIIMKLKLKDKFLIFLTKKHYFNIIHMYCILRDKIKDFN
ncbi:MAG: glycosyltransferase [Clostridium butyricum]